MEEIIFVDKPTGMTSFGVVARVRRQLSQSCGHKVKVGHTGTLDPFATGLLVLLAGKATKQAPNLTKLDKEYVATLRLGAISTTDDPEGEISENANFIPPSRETIAKLLEEFLGEIQQTPPIFSAIKINGRRAYDLARKGQNPKMPTRTVRIYEIEILQYNSPYLILRTKVSSGTYIRSLARDLGTKIGCGAYLTELRRTKIGDFDLSQVPLTTIPK